MVPLTNDFIALPKSYAREIKGGHKNDYDMPAVGW